LNIICGISSMLGQGPRTATVVTIVGVVAGVLAAPDCAPAPAIAAAPAVEGMFATFMAPA
jgi:K+ transporter